VDSFSEKNSRALANLGQQKDIVCTLKSTNPCEMHPDTAKQSLRALGKPLMFALSPLCRFITRSHNCQQQVHEQPHMVVLIVQKRICSRCWFRPENVPNPFPPKSTKAQKIQKQTLQAKSSNTLSPKPLHTPTSPSPPGPSPSSPSPPPAPIGASPSPSLPVPSSDSPPSSPGRS